MFLLDEELYLLSLAFVVCVCLCVCGGGCVCTCCMYSAYAWCIFMSVLVLVNVCGGQSKTFGHFLYYSLPWNQ